MQRLTLDLSQADGYSATLDEVMKTFLLAHGLLKEEFLYTAVDGDRSDRVAATGTYRKNEEIFAFRLDELQWYSDFDTDECINNYLEGYSTPAIVVYKKSHFEESEYGPYLYQFKHPDKKTDALEAIVLVTNY
ncbi:MAG TPA: hypothetical protein VJC39_02530 [Candidatus Nanoarchaeia archaeon]|nr:hypothetical protein [Candidatus Nanoarchaeia archaeon]